jgi:O-antigen ligase
VDKQMGIVRRTLRPSYEALSVLKEIFGSLPWPTLLVMVLIPILGVFVGYGVSRESYLIVVIVVAAVPVGVFLLRQPFDAIIIWLLVAPLFAVTFTRVVRMGYWITHRTIIPVAAIVTLIARLTQRRLHFDRIDFFVFAYVLINFFSVLYHHPDNTLSEIYYAYDTVLVSAALFWLLRTTAPNEAQLKRLVVALIFVALVQGSVGLMQNTPGVSGVLPQAWMRKKLEAGRTTGTLVGVADFGVTLAISTLPVVHYVFHTRKRHIKTLGTVAALLACICLLLSFSRSTWLASAITGVLIYALYPRTRFYILILTLIVVLILSASLFVGVQAFASERLHNRGTVDTRIISNYAQLRMIWAKPLLGWGIRNLNRYQADFVKPVGGVAVIDPGLSSHNTLLSMAVELGLLGLAAYLMPWLLLVRESITVYKRLPRKGFYGRYLLLVLWLGVVFWLIVSQFFNYRIGAWGMPWVQLPLGLIASIVDANQKSALSVVSRQDF